MDNHGIENLLKTVCERRKKHMAQETPSHLMSDNICGTPFLFSYRTYHIVPAVYGIENLLKTVCERRKKHMAQETPAYNILAAIGEERDEAHIHSNTKSILPPSKACSRNARHGPPIYCSGI